LQRTHGRSLVRRLSRLAQSERHGVTPVALRFLRVVSSGAATGVPLWLRQMVAARR